MQVSVMALKDTHNTQQTSTTSNNLLL